MNDTTNPPLKRCSRKDKCVSPLGSYQPADDIYFGRDAHNEDGLRHRCRACTNFQTAEYRKRHPERARAATQRWKNQKNQEYTEPLQGHPDQLQHCDDCQRDLPLTTEYWYRNRYSTVGFKGICKDCDAIRRGAKRHPPIPQIEGMKRCSRGDNCVHPMGCWQPADSEHFGVEKDGAWRCQCRKCNNEHAKQYRLANPDLVREKRRQHRLANVDMLRAKSREYYLENRDEIIQRVASWRRANPEKNKEYRRRHYRKHIVRKQEYRKQYDKSHTEETRARRRHWYHENIEVARCYAQNRLARKRSLPDTLTTDEWHRAIDYFHGCCAACGRQLNDLFGTHKVSADHWIPLSSSDCPGTVATNMIPLCFGDNGCNNRKNDLTAEEWAYHQFGKRKGNEILKRIEAYFQWVREQGAE